MRIAILGCCGSIGKRHVNNLLALGHTDLLGCDVTPDVTEARFPIVESYTDVAQWKPEAVLICTPPDTHYKLGRHALQDWNAHTFIEKPMTETADEARDLCALAEEHKRTLAVGYMLRSHERLRRVKQWMSEQQLGVIQEAVFWCEWMATRKTYQWGGVLRESSHEIDLALWLFGRATVMNAKCGPYRGDMSLSHQGGTHSTLLLDAGASIYRRRCEFLSKDSVILRTEYEQDAMMEYAYVEELRNFLAGIPDCTGRDGLAVMDILEQVS